MLLVQQGIPHQLFYNKNINFVPSSIANSFVRIPWFFLFTDEDTGGSWDLAHRHTVSHRVPLDWPDGCQRLSSFDDSFQSTSVTCDYLGFSPFSLSSRNQQISGFVRPEVRAEISKLTKSHISMWLTAPAVNLDFARMLYFWHLPPFAFEHKRLRVTHRCDTIQMFQSPDVSSYP